MSINAIDENGGSLKCIVKNVGRKCRRMERSVKVAEINVQIRKNAKNAGN